MTKKTTTKKTRKPSQRIRQWSNNELMKALTADHDRIIDKMNHLLLHVDSQVQSLETLLRTMDKAKAPAPKPKPHKFKEGDWVVVIDAAGKTSIRIGQVGQVLKSWGKYIDVQGLPYGGWDRNRFRPATQEEIDAHLEAERKAEEAKPIAFGTRVKVIGRDDEVWKVGCDEPTDEGCWRLCPSKCGDLNTIIAHRSEFTIITPEP